MISNANDYERSVASGSFGITLFHREQTCLCGLCQLARRSIVAYFVRNISSCVNKSGKVWTSGSNFVQTVRICAYLEAVTEADAAAALASANIVPMSLLSSVSGENGSS